MTSAAASFRISIPNGRLDLDLCLNSGQVFRWTKPELQKWLIMDGVHWFSVKKGSEGFNVATNASQWEFERLFRLDWDAEKVLADVEDADARLASLAESLRGLRLLRPSNASETLFCFLCTPNNHIKRIGAMIAKLAALGEPVDEVDGQVIHAFPGVEAIASIDEMKLRALGFGYRGASIPNAARWLLDKPEYWLESLRETTYPEARDQLRQIPGVGPKLADCIALFALDHTESVPVDTHMWQVMTRLYHPEWRGLPLNAKRYEESTGAFRRRFGTLSGWAQQIVYFDNVLNARSRPSPRM